MTKPKLKSGSKKAATGTTHRLNLIGEDIDARQISAAEALVNAAGFIVNATTVVPDQATTLHLAQTTSCAEAAMDKALQQQILQLGAKLQLDIALQTEQQAVADYRLICFDMDSTLIQNEVMDEIAISAGIGEQISAITEAAMRGEITFKQSFTKRLALLEGFAVDRLPEITRRLSLSPGAQTLIVALRQRGLKIALFSGGFTYFAEGLQTELGQLDYIHANQLEINKGKLTGKIIGELVDEKAKARLIQQIANDLSISLSQTIAVGDGANDIPMLQLAGMGVAYHAKPIVRENTQFVIDHGGLDAIQSLLAS